jgi:hypothetical protein
MAAALTQPTRNVDSERARRRRDRHARLAADRALAEVALELRFAAARSRSRSATSRHRRSVTAD